MKKALFYLIFLTAFISVFCLLIYTTVQQDMRVGANDPQIQVVEDSAAALSSGQPISAVVPGGTVDISRSLAPFMVIYDDQGKPLAGSALLDGQLPNLPAGVFAYVKSSGETRITWQPRPGVRNATVIAWFSNPQQSGYVMAGRSLREVEKRIDMLGLMVLLVWVFSLVASFVMLWLGKLFFEKN
jgi:hypothetical protein